MKFASPNKYVQLACLACLAIASIMLVACAGLAKSGKAYQTDLTPQMQLQASRLRGRAPVPHWQTIAPASEIDELIPGPNGTTLVSFLEMDTRYPNSPALVPYYGPYALYNTLSGRELWRHQRDRNPDLFYSVLLTDPYLVYAAKGETSTRIAVVDPANGNLLWETTVKSSKVNPVVNGAGGVLAIHSVGASPKLSLYSLRRGKLLWSVALPSGQALLEFDGDRVLMAARHFTAYAWRSGQQLWSIKGPARKSEPLTMVVHDHGYIVAWRNGNISQVSSEGKLAWRSSLGGSPQLATVSGKLAIVSMQSANRRSALQAFSLNSGKTLWQRKLSAPLSSALLIQGNRLFYTSGGKVESLSIRDGRHLFSSVLSKRTAGRLPDHIVLFPKHIAVASESMVSGHAIADGHELWRIDLHGIDYLTQAVARAQLEGSLVGDTRNRMADVMQNYARNLNIMHDSSNFYARQARQNYINVYNRTQMAISSGDAAQRADAYFQRSLAASHERNVNMMNRSFDTMMLNVNTALNVLASARAVEENARVGAAAAARDRAYKRLKLSYKIHEAGLQGDYYLRPFRSRSGNGLVVVNLSRGKWAEIATGPTETILEDKIYMNIMPGLITANASLITLGTGLDPAKWQTDERFRATTLQSSMFAWALEDRYRTTLILRSLLSYKLPDVNFLPASDYEKSSLTRRRSRIIQ
jgi:outer membrane protein assembly factor BamB